VPLLDAIAGPLKARLPFLAPDGGARIVMDGLVLSSKMNAGVVNPDPGVAEQVTRGAEGEYEVELTGSGGGSWRWTIGAGTMRFARGRGSHPRATVTLGTGDFFRILTGKLTYLTASMTGRLAVRGDGHAALMLGGVLGLLRASRSQPGLPGRVARAWLDLAVRRSGTGLRFDD
jgi:putative sterol carrier protein